MSKHRLGQGLGYHALIVAMIASLPLEAILEGDSVLLTAFWGGLPVAAALVAARHGWRLLLGLGLAVAAAVYGIAAGGTGAAFVLAAAFGFTTVVILLQVFSHSVVTGRTISGALCGYLLIGVTFAQVFRGLAVFDAAAFRGADSGLVDPHDMVYFSFVTLTTVGYGDIAPVTDTARSFAVVEALLGQLYLVAVVARLVGLSVSPRPEQG